MSVEVNDTLDGAEIVVAFDTPREIPNKKSGN
jgi:hypothetical protein